MVILAHNLIPVNRGDVSLDQAKSELMAYESLLLQQDKAEENIVYQTNYISTDKGNGGHGGSSSVN